MGEVFDGILYLCDVGAEQRVLFQPFLILDDHSRNAKPLKGADHEHKVLGNPSGIAVIDDGLGGGLENVVGGVHPRSDVHVFDVGLGLDGRFREAAHPDAVEFPDLVVDIDANGFGNQPSQAAMGLDDAYQRSGVQQSLQHAQADLRGSAHFPNGPVERGRTGAGHPLQSDKLPAPLLERIDDALTGLAQYAAVPVVAVEHEVRLDLQQVRHMVERVLSHYLLNAHDVLHDNLAVLKAHEGQSLVAGDGAVG